MTRSASSPPERELAQLAAIGRTAGWRSHTFQTACVLDAGRSVRRGAGGAPVERIAELLERGARRLIVDASAIHPAGESLVAGGRLRRPPASFRLSSSHRAGSSVTDLLPASVGVALSLSDAIANCALGRLRRPARSRPYPPGASRPRSGTRSRSASRCAGPQRAAREGDYDRALAWLHMVERAEGRLTTSGETPARCGPRHGPRRWRTVPVGRAPAGADSTSQRRLKGHSAAVKACESSITYRSWAGARELPFTGQAGRAHGRDERARHRTHEVRR